MRRGGERGGKKERGRSGHGREESKGKKKSTLIY